MTRTRALAALSLIGLLSTCAEPPAGPGVPGFARLGLTAVAPPSLASFAPALVLGRVVVTVERSNSRTESSDTIASRVEAFNDNTDQLELTFTLAVQGEETLFVSIDYQTATGTALFTASAEVIVRPGATSSPPALQPFYVGPGNNIAFMSMSGDDTTVTAGDSVQLDVTAFDSAQAEVTSFYLTWSSSDPRITVSPRGVVRTRPGVTQEVRISARTPAGVQASTLITIQGAALMALEPDSVELRPSGTQLFRITVGSSFDISTIWSVAGIDGGDSAHGVVNVDGFYTAPATPLPGEETLVCVRDAQNASTQGCAKVRVPAVPSVGADVVVINDLNIFDDLSMQGAGNRRFVRNLVNTIGTGPRSSGDVVWSDRGRNSACYNPANSVLYCSNEQKALFFEEIRDQGYSLVHIDVPTVLTSVPSNVRAIIFWLPLISFDLGEINALKLFAAQGGRIIFIGEHEAFYLAEGLDVENAFLRNLGSSMVNVGNFIDCSDSTGTPSFFVTPSQSLRTHPLLNGVSSLRYVCASEVQIGANDFALFYDTTNTSVLGAVAKISLEPIGGSAMHVTPVAAPASRARLRPDRKP